MIGRVAVIQNDLFTLGNKHSFMWARYFNSYINRHLLLYFMCISSEGSGEAAHLRKPSAPSLLFFACVGSFILLLASFLLNISKQCRPQIAVTDQVLQCLLTKCSIRIRKQLQNNFKFGN